MNKKTIFDNILIEVSEKPPSNWNENLQNSFFSTYAQTTNHAEYRKKVLGDKPIFAQFFNKSDVLIGQILFFQSRLGAGFSRKFFGEGILQSLAKHSIAGKKFVWKYGPVVFENSATLDVMNSFGKFLINSNFSFAGHSHPLDNLRFPKELNFKKNDFATFMISFEHDLDTLFQNTSKSSVRKNILRSEKRNVTIREFQNDNDIISHYNLLREHRLRNNLVVPAKNNVLTNHRLGRNIGLSGFIALKDGIPVGSIAFSYFNGQIIEQGIARSTQDIDEKLYAQELLRWNIIKWGKEHNCKFYNLAGIQLGERNAKEEGIFRNKQKWGGTLVNYPNYYK